MASIQRYINLKATEGGADAFVEDSEVTNIVPSEGRAFLITEITVYIEPSSFYTASSDFFIAWSLTRDSKLAIAQYDDPECFLSDGIAHLLTTSGSSIINTSYRYNPPGGILLVEPSVYFQLDSTGVGGAVTAYARLAYDEVKVTEVDILRLLNNA